MCFFPISICVFIVSVCLKNLSRSGKFPVKWGFMTSAAGQQLHKYSSPFVSDFSQQGLTRLIVLLSTLNQQAALKINSRTFI